MSLTMDTFEIVLIKDQRGQRRCNSIWVCLLFLHERSVLKTQEEQKWLLGPGDLPLGMTLDCNLDRMKTDIKIKRANYI